MDRADYALKLMAEGKINLGVGNKNLEIEQMKLKNFRTVSYTHLTLPTKRIV